MATDTGFAPNPFWDYCTLACCKPQIRRTAKEGDWIVGLSKRRFGNKIIYAMKITEKPLTFDQYFNSPHFKNKIPDMRSKDIINRRGDNIYKPMGNNFQQLSSRHSNEDGSENLAKKDHDLGGKYVLVSSHFHYFGRKMLELPDDLKYLVVGRFHRCKFSEERIKKFIDFIDKQSFGLVGLPNDWVEIDDKCKHC